MINIPDSVVLKRSKKSETMLLAKSREWLEAAERTAGWHASDMLNPRKGYWQRVDPKPLDDRSVTVFLIGKILHGFVLGAMNDKVDLSVTDEGSSYSEELGISYSPDWDKAAEEGTVAEFKTSRSWKDPTELADVDTYIQQLLIYMAAKNLTSAELWVLYLNLRDEDRRTNPSFRAFTVGCSEEDLEAVRSQIKETKNLLDQAVKSRDHTALPLCWDFICNDKMCSYWDACKPEGRYAEPEPKILDDVKFGG